MALALIKKAMASTNWAIEPSYLDIMEAVVNRDDLQALGYADGKPLQARRPVEIFGSVAVVPVSGAMFRRANLMTDFCGATSTECLIKDLVDLGDNPQVSAMVLDFDTPGGDAAPMSEAAEYLRMIREETGKPIIGYVGDKACSAGYWLASQCDEIVISKTGFVGSIGVVLTYSATDDGSTKELVSANAKNKRLAPDDPDGEALYLNRINTVESVFIEEAATGRNMDPTALVEAGNFGAVVTGQAAIDANLADRLGTLKSLIDELNNGQPATTKTTKGGQSMTIKTRAELAEQNPELLAEIENAAVTQASARFESEHAEALETAKTEAAEAAQASERARVTKLLEADALGHNELITSTIKDGGDINALNAAVMAAESGKRKAVLEGASDDDANKVSPDSEDDTPAPKALTGAELLAEAKQLVKDEAAENREISLDDAISKVAARSKS
ncbi:MAG: hypothetical protein CMB99_16375 [Flavobacteriaceae bacterium]|nr:hypothetical protein [Flavobacteriaceae bacterium]|tara:strand:- start:33677 stop:35017 length:1341 start_codon:yes stop_codon:yes gene_type:complete